jgi:hypothetical protein
LTIEKWFLLRARYTGFKLRIIKFRLRAGKALLFLEIKIFWQKALNATDSSKERSCLWTNTDTIYLIIVSSPGALCAAFISNVKVLIIRTGRTGFSIKNRPFNWTSLAFLGSWNINKVFLAIFTYFLLVIEMLRKITNNTCSVSFKRFVFWALAF